MCGVDSPLDKLAIGVRVGPNMATVVEKTTHKHNNTIKMKNKCTNVNMQVQEVSRGWR